MFFLISDYFIYLSYLISKRDHRNDELNDELIDDAKDEINKMFSDNL